MPVTDVTQDLDARTLTITAEFAAPLSRVWQVYADPRQLERVWGPPGYPATVVQHDLSAGGVVTYYMTSPEGERFHGRWDVTSASEPSGFVFDDAFTDEDFTANPELPVSRNEYAFAEHDGGTRATYTSTYASAEALEQVLQMGMEEGAREAIGQIDELLAQR